MKHAIFAAAFAVAFAGVAQAKTFTDTFTSFYSFGDSLSDDGKFSQLFPPSEGGRFTNGLTWAERIEDEFIAAGRDTGNLALGGATAGDANLFPAGPLSTFAGQVATFTGTIAAGVLGLPTQVLPVPDFQENPPVPGRNPLLSVWFGANDIFQGLDPRTPDFDPVATAQSIGDNIRALNLFRPDVFDDFLVISLPDLGETPRFAGPASGIATAATDAFNEQLAIQVRQLRGEGLNIIEYAAQDVFDLIMDDVNSRTFSFGITDVDTPCTESIGDALTADPTAPPPLSCADPSAFLFADSVHPNATAHALFAEDVARDLSAIPVPAALPMMLTIIAGFGVFARRRIV